MRLTLDELTNENDTRVQSQGVTIVYTSNLEPYVADSIIDYTDNSYSQGFTISGSGLASC